MIQGILAIALLILISASGAFAQTVEQQAAKIRQLYADTNKRIETGLKDKVSGYHYAAWTVGGERDGQQWEAVGNMKTLDEFWFSGEPGMDAEDGEETSQDARRLIRKIASAYTGAADLRTRAEYYFDDQTGELVFAYTTELEADKKTTERRFYFNKGKLIRLAVAGKNTDAKFSADDLERAASEQESAKRMRNLFALMFSE